jgi:tRNA(fMet)-specific endonuclease VapC
MRFLLDTDICIDLFRGSRSLIVLLSQLAPSDCCVSVISYYELINGVLRSRNPKRDRRMVDLFFDTMQILPFDRGTAMEAANIRYELERKGCMIGPYDVLIAAQAREKSLTVVTRNLNEFSRVEGLAVDDWKTPGPR